MRDQATEEPHISFSMPTVSVIIPTYNSGDKLGFCLQSIKEQKYNPENIEILIMDGGSTDDTIEIAKTYGAKIIENKLKTAEAGKSLGIHHATGELILFIDSDNILDQNDWLIMTVKPLSNSDVFASESLYWGYSREHSVVNRYCAMTGVNDPLTIFIGNYSRYSYLTKRWTDLKINSTQYDDGSIVIDLSKSQIPLLGANGAIFRRNVLENVKTGDYYFDIDAINDIVGRGYSLYARVPTSVTHLFSSGIRQFIKKTKRRVKDYLYFKKRNVRTYPWMAINSGGIIKFVVFTIFVVPLFIQALRGYINKPDRAWFFHIPACWITLIIYSSSMIKDVFSRHSDIYSREGWKQ